MPEAEMPEMPDTHRISGLNTELFTGHRADIWPKLSVDKALELAPFLRMTYARKSLICLQATPYHHIVARCVRRAWLWGFDQYAGRDYSHRKAWVIERLEQLSSMFAIDICAYAIMSNHYHLVLYVDQKRANDWTVEEVVARWSQVFSIPWLVAQWQKGACGEAEQNAALEIIEEWRRRLCDISWYMRCLNEHLARRANVEDGCTGRFWEGRFKSQALLDECGLLTAMAYVDLNPIRAGIAATPEESEFTSVHERIQALQTPTMTSATEPFLLDKPKSAVRMRQFRDEAPHRSNDTLPFLLHDYLELVDWTGRARRQDKRGSIDGLLPTIVQRLNLDADTWHSAMHSRNRVFGRAVGRLEHMRLHAQSLGQSWIQGLTQAQRLYRRG